MAKGRRSRAGRPRNAGARLPNGHVKETPAHAENPWMVRRRLEGLGISNVSRMSDRGVIETMKDRRLNSLSHDHPLAVLVAKGQITDAQQDVGEEFGDLYCRLFGAPNARAADLCRAAGRDYGNPVRALADERRYAASLAAIAACAAQAVIMEMAVYLTPGWLIPDLVRGVRLGRHERRIALIRQGLDALANVQRVSISDSDRERALREVA